MAHYDVIERECDGKMIGYIKRIKGLIAFQVIFSVLAAISMAVGPHFQSIIIDNVGNANKTLEIVIKCIVIFGVCETLTVAFSYFAQLFSLNGKAEICRFLHEDLLKGIFNWSYKDFKKKDIGEYISINNNNVDTIVDEYYEPIINLVIAILKVIIFGVIVFLTIAYPA